MNYKDIIYIVTLVLVFGYFIGCNRPTTSTSEVKITTHKVDSLQSKVDSLKIVNTSIDADLSKTRNKVDSLSLRIDLLNKSLNKQTYLTSQKVIEVNKYGYKQIEDYFSNRYKQ